MVTRSDYTAPEQRDYVVERCPWIHQEAVVSSELVRDPSRMRSLILGSISEMAGQAVDDPFGCV